jgi:response regulator RpfG family c-di-GMP phosphodiesterase
MSTLDSIVNRKISSYQPDGNLGHTTRLILALLQIRHDTVKGHMERVGLLAEFVAKQLKKDAKAAFFAGLLHDVGKLVLPNHLFAGQNISNDEIDLVKTHADASFQALHGFHLFTAYCAGLHHAMYKNGYGLRTENFPTSMQPATIKKILEIATIVSICDFIDAFTHRKTSIRDGSDLVGPSLFEMLNAKYPDDHLVITIALEMNKQEIFLLENQPG